MYIAVWIAVLIIAICFSFFNSSTHLFVFACVVYALYYFASWSYKEGSRSWSWLRSLRVWNIIRGRWFTHHVHQGGQWKEFERAGDTFLFVVHPAAYGISTFLTFATPCNPTIAKLQPLIAMPRAFFYVPGLTDLVQWFGGIVHSHDAMAAALTNHRSVVWSPGGPMDHSSYLSSEGDDGSALKHMEEATLDNEDLFAWITAHGKGCNLYVVPVIHFGEENAYCNYTGRVGARWWLLGMLQSWCWHRFQYEFPVVLSGWLGSVVPRRGCKLTTIVGAPIATHTTSPQMPGKKLQKTPAKLKEDFLLRYKEIHALTTNIIQSTTTTHEQETGTE